MEGFRRTTKDNFQVGYNYTNNFSKSCKSCSKESNTETQAPGHDPEKARQDAKNNRAPRFNMEAAGTRRKELAKKINPSVDELKEYRDISEQIEREVQIKIDKLDPKGAKS